jgi:Bacterial HORMA domain family 1
MSTSATSTSTFTLTNAKHVAAKIMTDLDLLNRSYSTALLSETRILEFGDEAACLLNAGHLGTVTYGFKKSGNWLLPLRYTAYNNGTLSNDDRAGTIPRGVDVTGASFHSFLTYSSKWDLLSAEQRASFKAALPIQRTAGDEPGTSGGYWIDSKTYSSSGSGVTRKEWRML